MGYAWLSLQDGSLISPAATKGPLSVAIPPSRCRSVDDVDVDVMSLWVCSKRRLAQGPSPQNKGRTRLRFHSAFAMVVVVWCCYFRGNSRGCW
jgi:hypothetical protein